MVPRRGLIFVLSSPSGAGKTTIARRLVARDRNLTFSISETTRSMRPGERDQIDYHFVTSEQFDTHVQQGKFLEHACVFGNAYGTPAAPVETALAEGRDVIFDVDWQGARQLREKVRTDMVSLFILPPSLACLQTRLRNRTQDDPDVIAHRMSRAQEEIGHWEEYDYVIVNHTLEPAIDAAHAILQSERLRRARQHGLAEFVTQLSLPANQGVSR